MSECGPEVMIYVDTPAATQRFYVVQGGAAFHSPLLWGAIANAFRIMRQEPDRARTRIHRWLADSNGPKHIYTVERRGKYLDVETPDGTVFWKSPRTCECRDSSE